VVTHGHRHPSIISAIKAQVDTLDQVIFAEFTHAPAESLARQLVAIAPLGLEHVFFSDSGSTCVEVAIKMALGFWQHTGGPRHRIVVMEHSYHGDTIGAMSEHASADVLLRPLGNTLYVVPPYCVTRDDLTLVYDTIGSAVDAVA
jgi:adenosylmethionine-8-amino-7-oxononanoate aminotransferase